MLFRLQLSSIFVFVISIFYDLEYSVHLDDRDRHELSTVVIDRGRLYTLATSTNEVRWGKVKGIFEKVITSFTFLI